jgi:serine/threonine-protein phosphatase 2A activator
MTFQEPRKFILTKEQLEWFQTSDTHQKILSYIEALNEAVVGAKLTDAREESEV